jgi:hypothetical protein
LVGNDTLRASAAHGYGSVDIKWAEQPNWITLELADLSNWNADPHEKHVTFGVFGQGLLDLTLAPQISERFEGQRGLPGFEGWSAGFYTLSSDWQQYNLMFYAEQGQKVAFLVAQTAKLAAVTQAVWDVEGLPAPSPNRAVSWYWTGVPQPNEANLDAVIARAQQLGAELMFFTDLFTDLGDFEPDPARWPSGFEKAAARVRAAGMKVGIHFISPGASIGTSFPSAFFLRHFGAPEDLDGSHILPP